MLNSKKFLSLVLSVVVLNVSLVAPLYAEGQKLLRAAIAEGTDTPPTDSFRADVPKLYAFYIGIALKEGDSLRGLWIAEDVGAAAPKNTKIDESTIVIKDPASQGAFSISKPTNGWPIGTYRVDFYVDDKLAESTKFSITPEGKTSEDESGEDEEK